MICQCNEQFLHNLWKLNQIYLKICFSHHDQLKVSEILSKSKNGCYVRFWTFCVHTVRQVDIAYQIIKWKTQLFYFYWQKFLVYLEGINTDGTIIERDDHTFCVSCEREIISCIWSEYVSSEYSYFVSEVNNVWESSATHKKYK